jgi:membrane protein
MSSPTESSSSGESHPRWGVLKVARETYRGFALDHGWDLAASLAFSTLLMAVPLAVTFSILLATFFQQNDRIILDVMNVLLPYQAARVTANVHEFIDSAKAISGIGLVALLATSLRLIFLIENTVNIVWGAPKRKGWIGRVAVYTLGLFVGALLVAVFFTGLQQLKEQIVIKRLVSSALSGRMLSSLVVAAALTLLYRFLPNARVSWRAALVGGGLVALGLRLIKIGVAVYFTFFTSINVIYGSLSLLFLALIFLDLFWVLVLLGVELTYLLSEAGRSAPARVGTGRVERAVRLLIALSDRPPSTLEEIHDASGGAGPEIEVLVAQLAADGLLAGDRTRGFALTESLERIPLSRVLAAVSPDLFAVRRDATDRVARILRRLFRKASAEQRAFLDVTLRELAGKRPPG